MVETEAALKNLPTLGRYRVLAQLGSGGMAVVYLAVLRGDRGFNKLVVLKVPRDTVTSDGNMLAMFLDEARLAARLNHPNVVQTNEIVHEGGHDMMVMEYLDGYSLHDLYRRASKRGVTVPLWMPLLVMTHALTGLHHAHEAKDFNGAPLELVHRDVSPHNVFITFDGQVKVLDFGVAKATTSTHQTDEGSIKGKVRYMAFEQLSGIRADRRADIFAAGVVLWEAAVGEPLWKDKNDVEVMKAVIDNRVPAPRDVNPSVHPALDAICRKAMAHERDDRYGDCLALRADLEAFLATLPEAGTMRELVAFMEDLFAVPRRERQQMIEQQLARLDLLKTGDFATLDPKVLAPAGAVPLLAPNASPSTASPEPGSGASSIRGRTDLEVATPAAPTPAGQRLRGLALRGLVIALGMAALLLYQRRGEVGPVAVAPSVRPAAVPPSVEPAVPPAAPADSTPVLAASAPASSAAVAATPPAHAVAPRGTSARTPPPAIRAPAAGGPDGFLSLDTYPWTKVSEGEKVLGQTPLVRVPLAPGEHVLTLENADQGLHQTSTVTIKSGEVTSRRLGLK